MISADHPQFSCTPDMSLTIYGKIFSGPLVHTNDPSGTVLYMSYLYLKGFKVVLQMSNLRPVFKL